VRIVADVAGDPFGGAGDHGDLMPVRRNSRSNLPFANPAGCRDSELHNVIGESFSVRLLLVKRSLNTIKYPHNEVARHTMPGSQQRDLNLTRERIMAGAQKEFAVHGFAGARTDAIARRAHVNERMIFYCFESKEGLYRAVLKQRLAAKAAMIESTTDLDFAGSLVNGFAECCDDSDSLRMWQWEAIDRSNRKLVAEEERRAYFQAEVARWRRAKTNGALPADFDEEMLLLVSAALRTFPLTLPQVTSLVTGMDPLHPEFRRKWSACLEWIGQRLFASANRNRDELKHAKSNDSTRQNKAPVKTRPLHHSTRRAKGAVQSGH
jgi:TetR/AcrR family transcriptional regulator